MSELGSLCAVVLAIYLAQCIVWVPIGTSVFALNFQGKGKRRSRGLVWSGLKTEGFLAWPLPPLSTLAVVAWPGFELDPEGVTLPDGQAGTVVLPWENLSVTCHESKLLCDGHVVFRGSEAEVLSYSAFLEQLRRAPQARRGAIIRRWLSKSLKTETVARRLRSFTTRSRLLAVLSNLQFVFLFVVPLAFGRFGPAILWRAILFLFGLSALIALEFWTLHKRLFPKAGNTRFKLTLTVLLSPVAAIRSRDGLARELFAGCHPVSVAAVVLSDEAFSEFAGQQLRLWRCSGDPGRWYPQTLSKLMEETLNKKGIQAEQLLRPARIENGCVAYCPQCLAQYVKDDRNSCSDCGFGHLVAFSAGTLNQGQEASTGVRR